jgi:hypothetical protein
MVMLTRNFFELLAKRQEKDLLLCVGLDPSIPGQKIAGSTQHLYLESINMHPSWTTFLRRLGESWSKK